MSKSSLFKISRGILVAIIATIIIGFMVIILGPLIPFIPFDGIFPLIIICTIFILTLITYFFLPPEVNENEDKKSVIKTTNLKQ